MILILLIYRFVGQIQLEDTVEAMSSGKGPKSKLSQAVTQRWTNICKMLMRFLQKWDALVAVYATKEKHFPLSGKKEEVSYMMWMAYTNSTE